MIFVFFSCNAQEEDKYLNMVIVHDPVMILQDDTYYMFHTGKGISIWRSTNMQDWEKLTQVFDEAPKWAVESVPDFKNHIWAPDILYYNDRYYLFYSVSSFAKNTSCIGLATNKTLDPDSPEYKWEDQGKIIQSIPGRDEWNAIDPNIAFDGNNTPWMSFGSFWNGIKLVKMRQDLTGVAQPEEWYTLAKRKRDFSIDIREPGDGAVEAPFIFKRKGFYYLFVSFDYCCRGLESNYKIVVGRAKNIEGPYLDKMGKRMDQGGGYVLLNGNKKYSGVGHNSIYTFKKTDYLIYHAYDIDENGIPKLIISPVSWDESEWPVAKIPEHNSLKRIKNN
ncbi:MAG: arabinan endo-1,5-alpha-L-arabinosidase [Bacteroidales bacterium]|nr:arabinan endo-1,5-alpha-L-arabinosidase [Bacteroidales bacterium]